MSEQRVIAQQKKAVAQRANQCCEYCQSQLNRDGVVNLCPVLYSNKRTPFIY